MNSLLEHILLIWGKSDRDDPSRYHPLLFHMLDVANVAHILWDRCLSPHLRHQISNEMNLDDASCLHFISFLAGLHDIGKAAPQFQKQHSELAQRLEEAGLHMGRGEPKPHGVITACDVKDVLRSAGIASAVADILAKVTGAHHGVFPQAVELSDLGSDSLGDAEWSRARSDLVHVLWQSCCDGTVCDVDLSGVHLEDPATVPILAGLISVADWIGSNTDYFPLSSSTVLHEYMQESGKRSRKALKSLGWLPAVQPALPASFSDIFRSPQMRSNVPSVT